MNTELVDATCRCGHVGKSRYPDTYRCSACYYGVRVASGIAKAKKLRARADKLDQETIVFRKSRRAFMDRHPGAGITEEETT